MDSTSFSFNDTGQSKIAAGLRCGVDFEVTTTEVSYVQSRTRLWKVGARDVAVSIATFFCSPAIPLLVLLPLPNPY